MASWHDGKVCSRIDLFVADGLATCLSCGSSGDHPYAYEPIRQKSEIRLLEIQPGERDDPIRGELVISSTNSQQEYDAVSYTWADETGDDARLFRAFIGPGYVPITRSCRKALQRIRSRFYTKCVWIDSLCVDQDNRQERGHQVNLMPLIYTRARKTYVYIGPTTAKDERTLEALATGRIELGLDVDKEPFWVRLNTFLHRPYFFRVWVIQEIALSSNPVILCGEKEFPWSVLQSDSAKKVLPEDVRIWLDEDVGSPLFSLGKRRLRGSAELPHLLRLGRRCQASDPRDRVFALLGLVVAADADSLVADYERSTPETFIWIARYLANTGTAADVLGNVNICQDSAGTGRHLGNHNQFDLPSWVPDWTNAGLTFVDRYPEAIGYLRTLTLQSDELDMNALILTGFKVGHTDEFLNSDRFLRTMLVHPFEAMPRCMFFQVTNQVPETPFNPPPMSPFVMILQPVRMNKDWKAGEVPSDEYFQGFGTRAKDHHNIYGTFRFFGLLETQEPLFDEGEDIPIPSFTNASANVSIKLV